MRGPMWRLWFGREEEPVPEPGRRLWLAERERVRARTVRFIAEDGTVSMIAEDALPRPVRKLPRWYSHGVVDGEQTAGLDEREF
jgi:hypothetical protein